MITPEREGSSKMLETKNEMMKLKGVKGKNFSHFLQGAGHKKLRIFTLSLLKLRQNLFAKNYIKSRNDEHGKLFRCSFMAESGHLSNRRGKFRVNI